MEDAISGPVDKDTSSYGERGSSASPSMMLNVPANGNLNNEQQSTGEPERGGSSNMYSQQQMMEQNYGQAQVERQRMMNGSLMKQMMAKSRQQQPAYKPYESSNSSAIDSGFGEEQTDSMEGRKMRSQGSVANEEGVSYRSSGQTMNDKQRPRVMSMMDASQGMRPYYPTMQQRQSTTGMTGADYDSQMRDAARASDDSIGYTMSPIDSTTTSMTTEDGTIPLRQNRADIRKMSPAMMNAMLNKLVSMKQRSVKQHSPATMTPVEMMSDMMMPSKRDQYKRLMLSALMQQKQQQVGGMTTTMMPSPFTGNYNADNQEQQQLDNNNSYGQQKQMGDSTYMMPNIGNRNAGPRAMQQFNSNMMMANRMNQDAAAKQQASNYMNKMMMMMMMMNNQMDVSNNNNYRSMTQEPQNRYGGQQKIAQRDALAVNMYGNPSAGKPMSRPKGYGLSGDARTPQTAMTNVMKALTKKMSGSNMLPSVRMAEPMNGFRQAFSQEHDQAERNLMGPHDSENQSNQGDGNDAQRQSYSGSIEMKRPAQTYGQDDEQRQQQQGSKRDEGYGAAPMGTAEPFAFDYKIADNYGNGQYRKEESNEDGAVRGTYGYMDAGGIYRHVEYVADENGFRAKIKSNEPGLSNSETSAAQRFAASGQKQTSDTMTTMMADNQRQQMQEQQIMMLMPTQTELNENAEK